MKPLLSNAIRKYYFFGFFILLIVVMTNIRFAYAQVLGFTVRQSLSDSEKAKNPATITWTKEKSDSAIFVFEGAIKHNKIQLSIMERFKLTPFLEYNLSTEFDNKGKRNGNEIGIHIRGTWIYFQRNRSYNHSMHLTSFLKTDYGLDAQIIGVEYRYSPNPSLPGIIDVIPLDGKPTDGTCIYLEWEPTVGLNISRVDKTGSTSLKEESIRWAFAEISETITFEKLNGTTLVGKYIIYKILRGFDDNCHTYFEAALNLALIREGSNKATLSLTYKKGEKSTEFKEKNSMQLKLGVFF